jgi:hypothetical protein
MVSNGSFVADYEMSGVRGLAIYQLQPDGSLKGVWTASNRPGIGKEDLVPAK